MLAAIRHVVPLPGGHQLLSAAAQGAHVPARLLFVQRSAPSGTRAAFVCATWNWRTSQWDFTRWQPDVLVVTLGTNDYADYPPGSCAAPDSAAFESAYVSFLTSARGQYPNAEIFAVGTFIATASNQFGACNQNICAAVAETADPKIHCIAAAGP